MAEHLVRADEEDVEAFARSFVGQGIGISIATTQVY
jgi:hypothetical protein